MRRRGPLQVSLTQFRSGTGFHAHLQVMYITAACDCAAKKHGSFFAAPSRALHRRVFFSAQGVWIFCCTVAYPGLTHSLELCAVAGPGLTHSLPPFRLRNPPWPTAEQKNGRGLTHIYQKNGGRPHSKKTWVPFLRSGSDFAWQGCASFRT